MKDQGIWGFGNLGLLCFQLNVKKNINFFTFKALCLSPSLLKSFAKNKKETLFQTSVEVITGKGKIDQASSNTKPSRPILKKPSPTSGAGRVADSKSVAESKNETAPGPVLSSTLNPMRSVNGAQSSFAVKRKRQDEKKPWAVSKEEAAALKAREAVKRRVEEREKPLLGLYKGSC
ncbi:zinc finger protein ZOP1-like [Hibiscus syriacus]|uniref:zinc finger protein ZOP1-like n=1 Tax=Hibiscus syriacus TaxID=106335 RepID=UPI0019222F36|nr:zinc finger protein ZOP1-like [Hibiscus syriacus]